jgi:alpha-methylacyl-CoA racemase
LASAAEYLGLPNSWGLTAAGKWLGGAHAGYRLYPCKDGRVALAALEPHFAAALCKAAGVSVTDRYVMTAQATHSTVAAFLIGQTCRQLTALGAAQDIPLYALKD